jgi:hypothetical protein
MLVLFGRSRPHMTAQFGRLLDGRVWLSRNDRFGHNI